MKIFSAPVIQALIGLTLSSACLALPVNAQADSYQEVFTELSGIQREVNKRYETLLAGFKQLSAKRPEAGLRGLSNAYTPLLDGKQFNTTAIQLDSVDTRLSALEKTQGDKDFADHMLRASAITRAKDETNSKLSKLAAKSWTLADLDLQAIKDANAYPWVVERYFSETSGAFESSDAGGASGKKQKTRVAEWIAAQGSKYREKTVQTRRDVLGRSPANYRASYEAVKQLFGGNAWVVENSPGRYQFLDRWGNVIDDRYLNGRMIIATRLDKHANASQPVLVAPGDLRYNIFSERGQSLNAAISGVIELASGNGIPDLGKLEISKAGSVWNISTADGASAKKTLLGTVSPDGSVKPAPKAKLASARPDVLAVTPPSQRLRAELPPATATNLNRPNEHPWHKPKVVYKLNPSMHAKSDSVLTKLPKHPEKADSKKMAALIPAGAPKVDNHYLWIITDDLTFYYAPKFQLNHNPNRQEVKHRDLAVPMSQTGGSTVVMPARMGGEMWYDGRKWIVDNDSSYCFPNVRLDNNGAALYDARNITERIPALLIEYGFVTQAEIDTGKVVFKRKGL